MEPTLKKAFYNDVYSNAFNKLRFLGQWDLETDSKLKRNLYLFYKCIIGVLGFLLGIAALVDLYLSRNDFKKVVFNICTTTLINGIWVKNLHLQLHSTKLNKLRKNLFEDGWAQNANPEDVEIKQKFEKIMLYHKKIFYLALFSLLPLWLITSLMSLVWGPRQMPFAVWTPVDLENDFQFFLGFLYQTVASFYISAETIQADLAMFSLLLQIASQYCILANDVLKINDLYSRQAFERNRKKRDINKVLLNQQVKQKFRECVQRQMILMGYVKELENAYSKPLMIQLICGLLLSIGNGLELIVVSMSFSMKLSYQVGYSLIVLSDLFMYCNLADLLLNQGQKVVWSLYETVWYEMDGELRQYLILIIAGAQKGAQTPLTAAKMFSLNLPTFLGILKNIYSWLALFRQLVIKK